MSKRNRREHGRIISVETLTRGDALAADVAAGATSITVNDAGDFDEDGGWLYIGAQTVEYTACDDDTGIITLATALTAAGEQGDPVQVWSDLYGEVVDYQLALVELDGEYDNPDPVAAEIAEGVGDLPEGDRGKAGESCTLLRVADDEWEVDGVGGRARKSKSIRWEQDDTYTITAGDVAAGVAYPSLSHRPMDESVDAKWNGLGQRPAAYSVDYDSQQVTWPLSGFERAGDVIQFHYTYRKGIARNRLNVPLGHIWRYKTGLGSSTTYADPAFDDSTWATGPTPFGYNSPGGPDYTLATTVPSPLNLWTRLHVTTHGGDLAFGCYVIDDYAKVYLDGVLVWDASYAADGVNPERTVACPGGDHVIAIYASNDPLNADDAYSGFTIHEGG